MGRQFMVVLVVFVINLSGSPLKYAEVFGLPFILPNIFLGSGLAVILYTVMVGQLNSQVNGCHYMLDYINVHALHALGCYGDGILSGKPIESQEEEHNPM
jgi:hypothetical protein